MNAFVMSLKNHTQSTWFKFFCLIFFPVLLILLGLSVIVFYNFNASKQQIQSNTSYDLKRFAAESERKILNIIQCISFVKDKTGITDALRSNLSELSVAQLGNALDQLIEFGEKFDIVDNMAILDCDTENVLVNSRKHSLDEYYSDIYNYENYSTDYWVRFKFYDTSAYQILSPSNVQTANGGRNIIPVVFRRVDDFRFRNYLVVNLNLDTLISANEPLPYTKNTKIYVLNRYTGQVFDSDNSAATFTILDSLLYRYLVRDMVYFDYNDKKFDNSFVSACSTSNNLVGYTYFSVTPYSDVHKALLPSLLFTMAITTVVTCFSVIIALASTKKVLTPLKQIASIFNPDLDSGNSDIVETIKSAVSDIFERNLTLSKVLPLAHEKYLINYLNSTEYAIGQNVKNILLETLPFKHEFFAAVIIQLYPTNIFHELYSKEEYENIRLGFYNIVTELFCGIFDTFVISDEPDVLYIILNSSNDEQYAQIEYILNEFTKYLENDSGYMELFIGVGGMYQNLEGLKIAHEDAMRSIKNVPISTKRNLSDSRNTRRPDNVFNRNGETELFYLLSDFKIKEATDLIKATETKSRKASKKERIQVYSQVISVILKVMRIKGIPTYDNKFDYEITNEILDRPLEDIFKEILLLLGKFTANAPNFLSKSANGNIIAYIRENYQNSDLSLDLLAALFRTRSNYVSVLIKNRLGVGFHEFLTDLRISEAKELLSKTDKNIQEIYEQIGYTNKQTFFRAFKTKTGLTPSEYRKKPSK